MAETMESCDMIRQPNADTCLAALRKIRALPTYSISQGICIDASPDRLLKADQVYSIIDAALASQSDASGEVK